jgi:TPR repeat protein
MRIVAAVLVSALCLPAFAELKSAPVRPSENPKSPPSPAVARAVDCDQTSLETDESKLVRSTKKALPERLDPELLAQARAGDPHAAWRAALANFRGDCSASNYAQALGLLQTAAQAGHACATGAWGLMLARGWGASRDLPEARELLGRAAQAGCRRAHYWSWLADESSPRPQTREQARARLVQGAELADGHALNALGTVREADGERDAARALYARSAQAGNATARVNLARLARYFSKTSEKPSMESLLRRANSGEAQAQYLLARRYHQGDSVAVNYVQAMKWYQEAAQKGNAAAREMLTLVQARAGSQMQVVAFAFADLAQVDVSSDEINKQRGLSQPVEDTDPFAGL